MPKIDISKISIETNTNYPEPFWKPIVGRQRQRLGNAVGLSHFGVNLTTLKPGAWSSQRHWHAQEDEFIYVIEGEITLVEDHSEIVLKPGDAAGWKAGSRIGHHLINKTQSDVRYIEIGTRSPHETAVYPDIDMRAEKDKHGSRYVKKTGEAYPVRKG